MPDITALGEILIDFTPTGKQNGINTYGQNPGGAPANVLATVSKYGGTAAFIGKVGKDMFGDFLTDSLKKANVDTSRVAVDEEHNTTLAFVALDENGDRSFSFYRNFGADIYLTKEEIPAELIQSSKIFHFGSLSLTDEPARSATDYALKLAKDSGCVITFDPNYRELLWKNEDTAINTIRGYIGYADIMKVSKEEAQMLGGEQDTDRAAGKLMDTGLEILLITDGANGVTYYCREGMGFVPAIKVKAVDTTGAGDIFFGTFIYEFLKDGKFFDEIQMEHIENYIGMAVRTSGLSTTKAGAIPSIPEYEEVLKL
ncbi:MAG: carbohydrate kinase [Candidatus Ornithomonoglobus sp.]